MIKKISIVFLLIILGCLSGCLKVKDVFSTNPSFKNQFCETPSAIQASPKTIEDVVELINKLPKPVSVACFLASLKRPLYVSMTSNTISAQPAMGLHNPRIFIMIDNLVISVVPDGAGAEVIEFSLFTTNQRSIKAELSFPVSQNLNFDEPYTKVLNQGGVGTVCAACHMRETREVAYSFAEVYSSVAFQPRPVFNVDLNQFKNELDLCQNDQTSERCQIIKAFLGQGSVFKKDFPEDLPFF